MRIPFLAAVAAVVLAAATADAQTRDRDFARLNAGGALLGGIPVGDFGDQVDNAFGLGGHLLYRAGDDGLFAGRFDAGWLLTGWDDDEVVLDSPLGGSEEVDLESSNSVFYLLVGPELSARVGGARPYVGGSIGIAYFLTDVSADWEQGDFDVETTVRQDDLAFAYGGHAGVLIPIRGGRYPISLDFGARYLGSQEADFLGEDDVDVDDGVIVLSPVNEAASVWIFHAGISVGLDQVRDTGRDRDRRRR